MTDNTQPESLIAEYRPSMPHEVLHDWANDAVAELRRQNARIAELEAELDAVGAGGVQALSAAPQDNLTRTWELAEAWGTAPKRAASPTPKAEQPDLTKLTDRGANAWAGVDAQSLRDGAYQPAATTEAATPKGDTTTGAALGGAYARLPDFDSGDEPIWEAVFKWKTANPGSDASKKAMAVESAIIKSLRDFADRTHELRQQAAPKAAPHFGPLRDADAEYGKQLSVYNTPKAAPGEAAEPVAIVKWQLGGSLVAHLVGDVAEGDLLYKGAPPQQEAQEPTEIPEAIAYMAAERYKVVPSHESMFHRWAVVAGTGTQQLYLGREVECQNMARKFAGAFLDGAFVAMQQAAPQQEAQYDHGPQAETVEEAARDVGKWLNERPNRPLDLRHVAMLAHYATAPQKEAQEPTEIPEAIAYMAAERYKVVPSHESMFHRWAVVAGTGTQQLYLGREVECQNMARKFAGAFLDGAFVAMQQAAPQQEAQEPVAFMSPKQLAALSDPEGEHGAYLPVRKTCAGLFTQAIYTAPQPAPAELEQLKGRIGRIGLDIDRALHGHVNEQSPVGAGRLAAIAALAAKPAPLSDDTTLLDWLSRAGPMSICVVADRPHDGEWELSTDDVTGYGETLREAIRAAIAAQGGK